MHIAVKIPGENNEDKILIHGGEKDGKILSSFNLFNLKFNKWLSFNPTDIIPQLKGHSACLYFDVNKNEYYVIITGGVQRDHITGCNAVTNDQREKCLCDLENITGSIYAYKDQTFYNLRVTNKSDIGDKLKRYGHTLICTNDKILYMFGGFIQYKGYMGDLIKLTLVHDPKEKYTVFAEEIKLKSSIKGRMFGSVSYVFDRLIIFGGLSDNNSLNDFHIINLKKDHEVIVIPPYSKEYIYCRLGMSECVIYDTLNQDLARIFIFGGSYWSGKYLVPGMCNELLVVEVERKKNTDDISFDIKIPIVYREIERNVFHKSLEHNGNIFVFGGTTPNMFILNLPKPHNESLEVTTTLEDYMANTAKEKYEYLDKQANIDIKDDVSEDKLDELSLDRSVSADRSADKSKLDDSMINEKKQLIKEKKSGKFSYTSSVSNVTPGKKSEKSSFKKDMFDDYEVKEK